MEMFGLSFPIFAGLVLTAVAWIVLVIFAFTTTASWGALSLLLPPVALVFAITHWRKSKNIFIVAVVGCLFIGYGLWDKYHTQAFEERNALSGQIEESQAPPKPVPEIAQPIRPEQAMPAESQEAPPPPAADGLIPSTPSTQSPQVEQPVMFNIIDAEKYIGKQIRVTTHQGVQRIGNLLEVRQDGLVIEYKTKDGNSILQGTISEDQIEKLEWLP